MHRMKRRTLHAVGGLLVAGGTIAAVGVLPAVADNVQNDVVVGGNNTLAAGGSTTVSYRITANSGDDEIGCNATASSPATVIVNTPAGVTATPSTLTFTSCGTFQPVAFTSSTAADHEITVSVSDSGAGTYNTNPAKFTLQVTAATDTTKPVIESKLSPADPDGKNGWYTGDVTVEWTVSDPQSGVVSTTGCGPETVDGDTSADGETFTCTATNGAGLTDSQSVIVKRDASGPVIVPTLSPADPDGRNGWYTGDVTVEWTVSDDQSGIEPTTVCGPVTVDGDTSADGETFTCTATNGAGLTDSQSVIVKRDATEPVIELKGELAGDSWYYFGSVPSAPTCEATDAPSGLDGECSVAGYSKEVGTHTVTATATDKAGNTATRTLTYTVRAWTLSGFYQPVDMGSGVWNTAKGGSTVPLKFEAFADSELTSTATLEASFTADPVPCPKGGYLADSIEFTTTGGTSLRYDTVAGQFIQNWQTPKKAGACYRVTMTSADGSNLEAQFILK